MRNLRHKLRSSTLISPREAKLKTERFDLETQLSGNAEETALEKLLTEVTAARDAAIRAHDAVRQMQDLTLEDLRDATIRTEDDITGLRQRLIAADRRADTAEAALAEAEARHADLSSELDMLADRLIDRDRILAEVRRATQQDGTKVRTTGRLIRRLRRRLL